MSRGNGLLPATDSRADATEMSTEATYCISVCPQLYLYLVKDRQGLSRQDTVPALTRPDRTVATSSKDKAQLLASLFAGKMEVDDPDR